MKAIFWRDILYRAARKSGLEVEGYLAKGCFQDGFNSGLHKIRRNRDILRIFVMQTFSCEVYLTKF